jgi:branched-chain amino acid transport system permease protein
MYGLVAIGFSLVLGVLDRLNFAHTEVFMFGGFAGLIVLDSGGPIWLTVPIALVVGGLLGLMVEFICFRRITGEAKITAALSSVAVGLVIDDLTQKVFGTDPLSLPIPTFVNSAAFRLGGARITYLDLIIVSVTVLLMVGLHLLISRAKLGRDIRAVADSPENASLLGISVRRVTQAVFVLSSSLAGVAGLLYALRTGLANSDAGLTFGLKSTAIMAIGGMGDLRGAVIGGILIGVIEGLAFNFGLGQFSDLVVWVSVILVLLVRPAGIFGGGIHQLDVRA